MRSDQPTSGITLPPTEAVRPAEYLRVYKPAPPHNSLLAPAVCMCLACCRIVLDLRCPATNEDGIQCGDYKGHKKADGHTMLVCTTFLCAEERLLFDGEADG